jgi:hypothetical protein
VANGHGGLGVGEVVGIIALVLLAPIRFVWMLLETDKAKRNEEKRDD